MQARLGRADDLIASGALASLLASGAKLTDQVLLISALDEDAAGSLSAAAKRIGGPLLFGRLWERLGIAAVLGELLRQRAFEFAVVAGRGTGGEAGGRAGAALILPRQSRNSPSPHYNRACHCNTRLLLVGARHRAGPAMLGALSASTMNFRLPARDRVRRSAQACPQTRVLASPPILRVLDGTW